ncbi:MAG: CinA family protein [Gammaproteobacteria bacterium]
MDKTESIAALSEALVSELAQARKTVAAAESCTGGWIAKSLTDIAGSSACFAYGIMSYSNGAKESILGVSSDTLKQHGAVSEATVGEMANGVLNLSGADYAVAVSGVAGPDGGTEEKPVGTVWFAWASRARNGSRVEARKHHFKGSRDEVRTQSVLIALQGIRERLRANG